jgi:hypothetical protein
MTFHNTPPQSEAVFLFRRRPMTPESVDALETFEAMPSCRCEKPLCPVARFQAVKQAHFTPSKNESGNFSGKLL